MLTCDDSTTAMDRAILMAPTLAMTLLPHTVRVTYPRPRSSVVAVRRTAVLKWLPYAVTYLEMTTPANTPFRTSERCRDAASQ
jgi:hypothetical protein